MFSPLESHLLVANTEGLLLSNPLPTDKQNRVWEFANLHKMISRTGMGSKITRGNAFA